MKALAAYIMRGRLHAMLITMATAVLAMPLPFFSHLSGGIVVLVTLRNGFKDGLLMVAGAGLILGLMGLISSLDFQIVQTFILVMAFAVWLPSLLCATVLKVTRNLGHTVTLMAAISATIIVLMYLVLGDVASWWSEILTSILAPALLGPNSGLLASDVEAMVESLAGIMTGLFAAAMVITTMINLSFGRWMQALLYNPGGFRDEFQQLRLPNRVAMVSVVIALIGFITSGVMADMLHDLFLVLITIYAIVGFAIVHRIATIKSAHKAWLIGLYVFMIFAMPQVLAVLSMLGFVDTWLDFRARIQKRLS